MWNLSGGSSAPVALVGHRFKVWDVGFSPDSRQIISTGSDRTLQIREIDALDHSTILDGHDDEVWDVAWSRDGSRLATGSKDMTVRIWRPDSESRPRGISAMHNWAPRFSRTGKRLLTLREDASRIPTVTLLDASDGNAIARFANRLVAGFGANGEDVVLWNEESSELEHWNAATRSLTRGPVLEGSRQPRAGNLFAISQDGSTLAIGFERESIVSRLADGRKIATIPKPGDYPLLALALSPHGEDLALTISSPYTIWLHHLPSGRSITLTNHTEEVKGLAFSPDGGTLASAGVDRVIRLWTVNDGRLVGELVRYYEEASSVSFSPDGRLLASIGAMQSVDLWHLPTLRQVMSLNLPHAGPHIVFSPAGDAIAYTAVPNTVRILRTVDSTSR